MRFTQIIRFKCSNPDLLIQGAKEYDVHRASTDPTGFIGAKVLADRDHPGQYIVIAEFAEVDGQRTAAEEAELNNSWEEDTGWFQKFMDSIDGEPEWMNFDELYRTGITGNLRTG